MEDQELDVKKIVRKVKEYAEVRKELAILSAVEKGSQLLANFVTDGLVFVFLLLTILFGSFTLGFYLSEVMGNLYSGFLIVTGIYFLFAIILYMIKDRYLDKSIVNAIIKKFFRDRNDLNE